VSLEQLAAPQAAVTQLRDLVEESPGHPEACQQLERILAMEGAPIEARREALMLLRTTYEVVERREDVVRVIEQALTFVTAEDARGLRRELGSRLAILEKYADAMAHYAALLRD